MIRWMTCSLVFVSLGFGQDPLLVKPLTIGQLERQEARMAFPQASPAFNTAAADTPPANKTAKQKKSRKGLWIGLAVAGAAAVVTLVAVDRRLSNEGRGIFR